MALLRGINVGGNNKVNMLQLKQVFERAGMTAVSTYINSGNVLFQSWRSRAELANILEKAIEDAFGFVVKVLVWDRERLVALAKALPAAWVNDASMKCDVLFLWASIDSPKIMKQVTVKPDIDRVKYVPGALLWSVDRPFVTKSGLTKLVGTDLYRHMTVRNCNTLRKLASLIQ